jgi:hypothetical protein
MGEYKGTIPESIREKLHLLTDKEIRYFRYMWPKYGVLNITSPPGVAKSSIAKSIADKLEFNYIDFRLTMSDESDFKYPYLEDVEWEGKKFKVSKYAIPEWAWEANQKPTIIHFEELNRASPFIRNAALQILLERSIGSFKFNDNVLMISSGNLGIEDGTDVDEFDRALNNRLIHVKHTLTVSEWINNYAIDNIHPIIVSFMERNPEFMDRSDQLGDELPAYATPRSWTMLSRYITDNWGMDVPIQDIVDELSEVAYSYIGNSSRRFIKFCQDSVTVTVDDVINNWDGVEEVLDSLGKDRRLDIISALKKRDITKFTTTQLDNLTKFLKTNLEEVQSSYILSLIDSHISLTPEIDNFLFSFMDLLKKVRRINKPNHN